MKNSMLIGILSLLLAFMATSPAMGDDTKKILLLHSYHRGYKWTDNITYGVESILTREIERSKRQIEYIYMDTKRYGSPEYLLFLRDVYRNKFKDRSFDVIIASDNNALNFLLDYRDEIFGPTPVVFCGVNDFEPSQLGDEKGYTGINEATQLDLTLNLMTRLHPNARTLLVVEDDTTTGRAIAKKVTKGLKALSPDIRVLRPGSVSMPDLQNRIAQLPPDSMILHTLFFRDARGIYYAYDQSLAMLVEVAKVPIYGVWDFALGQGIVGGNLISGFGQGEAAGRLAMRVLNGEAADEIPVQMESPNLYMFDDKQLRRFDISHDQLPKDSVFINLPDPRLKTAHQIILALTVGSVVVFGLFSYLLILKRRHRIALVQLNRDLEIRVEERTLALERTNKELQQQIAERERAEARIREMAYHDPLTQLPNRNLFEDRFAQALAHSARTKEPFFILSTDLDGFKAINDKYGHSMGDSLLCAVAERLLEQIRQTDTLARWGGDEFVFLLRQTKSSFSVDIVLDRIEAAMKEPFMCQGVPLLVNISIGVATYPEDGHDLTRLLAEADRGMYSDKRQNKGQANGQEVAQSADEQS